VRAAVASQHSCGEKNGGGVWILRSRHAPHLFMVLLRSWMRMRKSRPTPDAWREESGYATAGDVPAVVRSRGRRFDGTTADGGSSAWSWDRASRWCCPGSCGGGACVAGSSSPTTRPFALPGKRFVKGPVLEKSREYLGTEHSYRKTAEDQGMPIMYDDRKPAEKRQPVGLAPSTVWRWLSWLGGMPGALRVAWDLIRQHEPNSTLHREAWAVSPVKYRSERRRETLVEAMQTLAVDRICGRIFGTGIFPRYATSQGFS
jgi:hypothetical protein